MATTQLMKIGNSDVTIKEYNGLYIYFKSTRTNTIWRSWSAKQN